MAAPTITLDTLKPGRLGNSPFGVLSGVATISSYDTAHPAVTGITGHFITNGKLRVATCGLSSNGYTVFWDATSKSFKAYRAAGTVAAGVIDVSSGTPTTHPVGVDTTSGGMFVSDSAYTITGGMAAPAFTAGAPTEATASTNVGTVPFIAVGQLF